MTWPIHQTWIHTYTGRHFDVFRPRPEDICIEDIAHALSQKCRWAAHCRRFYSVAEHSVLVARDLDTRMLDIPGIQNCPNLSLLALLHDAAEAYLPDVARPVKPHLEGFQAMESRVMVAILEAFGIDTAEWAYALPQIKVSDDRLLAAEAIELMGNPPWIKNIKTGPTDLPVVGWRPKQAEEIFLKEFHYLHTDPGTSSPLLKLTEAL